MQAREGPQMEFAQKLLWKIAPSFAMRSRLGVGAALARWLPYAEIAASAWSSEKMKRILGRSAAGEKLQESVSATANIFICMGRV